LAANVAHAEELGQMAAALAGDGGGVTRRYGANVHV
jgi:hypothetical protein